MILVEWSQQSPEDLVEMALRARAQWKPGIGRVQEMKDESWLRDEFRKLATQWFTAQGIPTARVRVWLNIQEPDDGPGMYDQGYPHVHADTTATTLVLYLDPGDRPAELHVFDQKPLNGSPWTQEIMPEAGKIVFIPNGVWHGVVKNRGTRDRIALIATAYPK